MWKVLDRATLRALLVATGWMLLCQCVCLLLWQIDWLDQGAAVLHWIAVGVVPPALALLGLGRRQQRR